MDDSKSERRQYFSERLGRGPKAEPLNEERLLYLVAQTLEDLRERGFMQEAFGYECVDAGTVDGSVGGNPERFFLREIGREGIWPYWEDVEMGDGYTTWEISRYSQWDQDTLFDFLEVMHDQVSAPVPHDGEYHAYGDCGWHYTEFNRSAGQLVFREELSEVLRRADPPYELSALGQVVEAGPQEFAQLLEAAVPPGTEHDLVTRRIDSSVEKFRARGSSTLDRQHAVRDLADVLEALRADLKVSMLPADENALFDVANNFAIRHNNRKQRGDYDKDVWLRWIFYVYLASIHAVLRVRQRPD